MGVSKVVDSVVNVNETVEDELVVVGSAIGGVDSIAGDGIAERLQALVGVVEGFDDSTDHEDGLWSDAQGFDSPKGLPDIVFAGSGKSEHGNDRKSDGAIDKNLF